MYNYNYRWRGRRRKRSASWLLPLVLILVGVPVGLELLTRVVFKFAGCDSSTQAESLTQQTTIDDAYRLAFTSNDNGLIGSANSGSLRVMHDPLRGYVLEPDQQNQFWQVNSQGFRAAETIPVEKDANEVRVFVLGGSAAFGYLSGSNQAVFSNRLETLLNERVAAQKENPDQFQPEQLPFFFEQVQAALALAPRLRPANYRVVNAAVPGHVSGNTLTLLLTQLAEFDPDVIILLNGYADLFLPSSEVAADIPSFAGPDESTTVEVQAKKLPLQGLWEQLYLVQGGQAIVAWFGQTGQNPDTAQVPAATLSEADRNLINQIPANEDEMRQRVRRYHRNLEQIVQWASANRKRILLTLQPALVDRGDGEQALSDPERALLQELGDPYSKYVQVGYGALYEVAKQTAELSANARVINLYRLLDDYEGQGFQSPMLLTDEAQALLAERLFEAIVEELALSPRQS
jgi:hypothetical protein